jgi:hypothetical protein
MARKHLRTFRNAKTIIEEDRKVSFDRTRQFIVFKQKYTRKRVRNKRSRNLGAF